MHKCVFPEVVKTTSIEKMVLFVSKLGRIIPNSSFSASKREKKHLGTKLLPSATQHGRGDELRLSFRFTLAANQTQNKPSIDLIESVAKRHYQP